MATGRTSRPESRSSPARIPGWTSSPRRRRSEASSRASRPGRFPTQSPPRCPHWPRSSRGTPSCPGGSFLLLGDSVEAPSPGLLRFLGWTALARALRPVVEGFAGWRDDERWLRRYCPTCGAGPAMGQIAGTEPARHRLLACGRCRTRWRWRRTQCPFCENDSHRLAGINVEGEPDLRDRPLHRVPGLPQDHVGQGEEPLLLADWTSLHLDLLAQERGLERKATSLYDLDSLAGT